MKYKYLTILSVLFLTACVGVDTTPGTCFYNDDPWDTVFKINRRGETNVIAEVVKEKQYNNDDTNTKKLGTLHVMSRNNVYNNYIQSICPNRVIKTTEVKEYQ